MTALEQLRLDAQAALTRAGWGRTAQRLEAPIEVGAIGDVLVTIGETVDVFGVDTGDRAALQALARLLAAQAAPPPAPVEAASMSQAEWAQHCTTRGPS